MESPAARLLELLSLLQLREHWNAPELAARLGTTTRTVRRDVTRLRELGYPVVADSGRTGGYRLGAGAALPPLLLSDDEAVAVAIGLRIAASGGVVGCDDDAIAALAKLEQVLPARLRYRVAALNASTVLVGAAGGSFADPEFLLTLAQGCRRHERVRFGYRDYGGNATDRRVEPYGLVNATRRWYLVAYDLDRDDWRTFRVDRVTDAALSGHRFEPVEQPDTGAMVLDAMNRAPYRWQAEVLLRATPEEAAAEIPPTVGALEGVDGGTRLRIGADDLDWIARKIAALPFDAEVVSPPELRDELLELGRRLARAHSRKKAKARAP